MTWTRALPVTLAETWTETLSVTLSETWIGTWFKVKNWLNDEHNLIVMFAFMVFISCFVLIRFLLRSNAVVEEDREGQEGQEGREENEKPVVRDDQRIQRILLERISELKSKNAELKEKLQLTVSRKDADYERMFELFGDFLTPGYEYFSRNYRREIKIRHPDLTPAEISLKLNKRWCNFSDDRRALCEKIAEKTPNVPMPKIELCQLWLMEKDQLEQIDENVKIWIRFLTDNGKDEKNLDKLLEMNDAIDLRMMRYERRGKCKRTPSKFDFDASSGDEEELDDDSDENWEPYMEEEDDDEEDDEEDEIIDSDDEEEEEIKKEK